MRGVPPQAQRLLPCSRVPPRPGSSLPHHTGSEMLRFGLLSLCIPTLALGQGPKFSDAHVHLHAPADWIATMDQRGIDHSVILRGRSSSNQDLAEAAKRWPGRLTAFASVGPEHREFRPLWEADSPRLGVLADSLLATGDFRGLGELSLSHFPGPGFPEADFSPVGQAMRSVMEAAQHHQVPVLIHCEITRLSEFEALLTRYPDVDVIWAHGGYTPLFLAQRLLERHPNLVYELSARTWPHHPRSPDYTIFKDGQQVWPEWVALIERYPTRFLVGTDAAGRATDADRITSVHRVLAQLRQATRASVASDNLRRLLSKRVP